MSKQGNKRIMADENVSAQDQIDFKTEISLENVDNTSDANKPVSTAQQTALDGKVPTSRTINGTALTSDVTLTADDISDTVTTNKFATSAQLAKVNHISVTQAVDLDQMETDIAALANGMVYKGNWDASVGTFPGAGAAQIGAFYYVSVAGTVDSVSFNVGDNIVAIVDNASTTTYAGNWSKHDQTDAVQDVVGLVGSISKSGLLTALNVEDGADVTDATNVAAAGATMDADTSLAGNGYFLDEDDMASDSATKVPSQQSVKAYSDDHTLSNPIVTVNAASSPYTASWGERIHADTSGGAITVNAPSASSNNGKKFSVEKTTNDANSVTVSGVYGAGTDTVDVRYENGVYQSDGSVVRRINGL